MTLCVLPAVCSTKKLLIIYSSCTQFFDSEFLCLLILPPLVLKCPSGQKLGQIAYTFDLKIQFYFRTSEENSDLDHHYIKW